MGVFIRQKGRHLYLDYRVGGRRYTEALHLTVTEDERHNREARRLAEIIRSKKELQIVSGEHGLLDPVEGKRPLVEYAEKLAETQPPKNPLPKSLRYLREHAGALQLGAVSPAWVEGYRSFLLSQDALGESTASKYLSALHMVLRRAVRDMILPRNPAEAVKGITAPEVVKVYLDRDELGRLASTPLGGELGAEVKRAFLFGCLTGLRVSDLRSLMWADISREPVQVLKRQGKTGRVVAVPLTDAAFKIISDGTIHHRDSAVFPRLSSTAANTNQYLVAWAKAAGVEKPVGWHTARHTFATLTLEGGADFATVSRLLGHTKVTTTQVYAKSTDKAKRAAVDSLPDLAVEGRAKG